MQKASTPNRSFSSFEKVFKPRTAITIAVQSSEQLRDLRHDISLFISCGEMIPSPLFILVLHHVDV